MEYSINDSKNTPPTTGWSLETPVWKTGLYIWQRVKVSYSTGNPSYTTPHCLESNIIEDVTGNIGDWIFRDKTEVLSGTEIFTDKADEEALVHVEVDGKSYQHVNPDARNMIPTKFEDWENGDYALQTGDKVDTGNRIRVPWLVKVEPSTTYYWDSNDSSTLFVIRSFNADGSFNNSWGSGGSTGSRTTNSSEHYLGIAFFNISDYETRFNNGTIKPLFQLASHSDRSFEEFTPPAPTPDYPIEIHSLNDFDVVSSVVRENLLKDSQKEWKAAREYVAPSYNLNEIFDKYPIGQTYTISFDAKSDDVSNRSTLQFYSNPGTTPVNKYVFQTRHFTGLTTEYQRFSHTITPYLSADPSYPKGGMSFFGVYDTGNIPTIRNIKIELGDSASEYAPSPYDIQPDITSPTIYKTNLLLDEPLRSVGDIKDRLFRDNDGLWKVERNIKELVFNGTETLSYLRAVGDTSVTTNVFGGSFLHDKAAGAFNLSCNMFPVTDKSVGYAQTSSEIESFSGHPVSGVSQFFYFRIKTARLSSNDIIGFRAWVKSLHEKGEPLTIQYELKTPSIETLPQSLQDKLNNISSYANSNYVYTVFPDKSDILSEKLKPTLHATFKSIAWANDFKYKFEQAKAMHSTDIWFAKGVSNTIAPNIGWSTDAPVWEDGLYIWSKTITTYGNGRTEETSPVCITGATGRSVDKIEEWYYLSNKSNSLEGGTWSKTPPTWTDGKYIWTKNRIIYKNPSGSEETSPINTTGGSGQKGDSGTDARTVRLNNVIHAVHFDQDGLMPSVSSIAFPTAIQGFSGVTPYYEFKMGNTIVRGLSTDSSWTLNTSNMNYSDFPLTVSVNVVINGQTMATDTVTIVGTKPGEDAYTVVLANESHTFVGDVSNAVAGNTTANVIAYRGGTQVGATIGSITGLPTGMTSTIYSNGTTAARVTFTVTTSMTSPNGVVNIPVTVNGKSFTKVFNYAIAFKGAKGDKGTDGIAGKDGVGIRTTVLAYASSTSGATAPTSGWTTTIPTVAAGNFLWVRTVWTYTDNSTETGYTVSRIGKDGNTGSDGVPGKDGVGVKSTVISYTSSASGTVAPTSAWTSSVPSVSPGNFLWTRTVWTYTDNTTETTYSVARMGTNGATGAKGDKGNPGENATARNFLLDSKPSSPIVNGSYDIADFYLAEKPIVGQTYTIVIKGELAATKTGFYAYNSGGSVDLISNMNDLGNGYYSKSFNWKNISSSGATASDTYVRIYVFTSTQTGISKIEWITMVKGSVPLMEWVPAHEDIYKYVDDVEIGGIQLLNGTQSNFKTLHLGPWYTAVDGGGTKYLDEYGLKVGDTITFRVYIKSTTGNGGAARLTIFEPGGAHTARTGNPINNNNEGYSTVTYTIDNDRDRLAVGIQNSISPGVTESSVQYKEPKLEKGNKPTAWELSPEDVAADVNKKTYNPVRYIRDWSNGSTANNGNHWYQLMAFDEYGNNRALSATVTTNGVGSNLPHLVNGVIPGSYASSGNGDNPVYVQVDLGQVYYNITEIKVWKYYNDGRTYNENKTEVSANGVDWYPIYDYTVEGEYTPTEQGKSIPNTIAKTHSILTATGTKNIIDQKADSKETAEQIEQARKDLIESQEAEVKALKAQIKTLDAQRQELEKARQTDMVEVSKQFVTALGRVSGVEQNLGELSADWNFINTNIQMSDNGLMIGNPQKGNYLLQQPNRLDFVSNGTVVAYVSNNELWINSGIFTDRLTIGDVVVRKNGTNRIRFE